MSLPFPDITISSEVDEMAAKENRIFFPQSLQKTWLVDFKCQLCFQWEICRERKYQTRHIWIKKQSIVLKLFGHLLEEVFFCFFKSKNWAFIVSCNWRVGEWPEPRYSRILGTDVIRSVSVCFLALLSTGLAPPSRQGARSTCSSGWSALGCYHPGGFPSSCT